MRVDGSDPAQGPAGATGSLPWPFVARRPGARRAAEGGLPSTSDADLLLAPAERRMTMKALARWTALVREADGLPPAALCRQFLPGEIACRCLTAWVATRPPRRVAAIEGALADVLRHATGRRMTPLVARLGGLALVGVRRRAPVPAEGSIAGGAGRPDLFWRAIALPFAPPPGAGSQPVALVVSWQMGLTAGDAARLRTEIRAALARQAG